MSAKRLKAGDIVTDSNNVKCLCVVVKGELELLALESTAHSKTAYSEICYGHTEGWFNRHLGEGKAVIHGNAKDLFKHYFDKVEEVSNER